MKTHIYFSIAVLLWVSPSIESYPYGLPICQKKEFETGDHIGEGYSGKVFKVTRKEDEKQFALKESNDNLSNEIDILSRIKGLGITADILCAGRNQNYYIMDLVNGVPLRKANIDFFLQQQHLLPSFPTGQKEPTVELMKMIFQKISLQMFSIIKKLLEKNIFHQDAHDGNWMVEKGTLKLTLIDYEYSACDPRIEQKENLYIREISRAILTLENWSLFKLKLENNDLPLGFQNLIKLSKQTGSHYPNIEEILSMLS